MVEPTLENGEADRLAAANAATQAKDWKLAAALWDALRADRPDVALYWRGAGEACREAGMLDQAERILAEGVTLFPGDAWIGDHYARVAAQRADWREALRRAEAVRVAAPAFWQAWLRSAEALVALGRFEEAEARCREAAAVFPEQFWPNHWAARMTAKHADRLDAIRIWSDLVSRFPGRSAAVSGLKQAVDAAALKAQIPPSAVTPGSEKRSLPFTPISTPNFPDELLEAAVQQPFEDREPAIQFKVTLAAGPPDRVSINFLDDHIEYVVPANFPDAERRRFLTNRWLSTRPLFAKVAELYPSLRGTCQLWINDRPTGPGLVFCGNAVSQICIPDSAFLSSVGYADLRAEVARNTNSWRSRKKAIFWRGSSSGHRTGRWQQVPRVALCLKAAEINRADMLDLGISGIVQVDDPKIVEEMRRSGIIKEKCPATRFMEYRYSVDVDGNSCSWSGLFTKLLMKNAIIKVDSREGFRQWYYDRLIPWRNFIPLSTAMTELDEIVLWLSEHDEDAEQIAARGQELAQSLGFDKVLLDTAPVIRDHIAATKIARIGVTPRPQQAVGGSALAGLEGR